jgi:hypothetical protein
MSKILLVLRLDLDFPYNIVNYSRDTSNEKITEFLKRIHETPEGVIMDGLFNLPLSKIRVCVFDIDNPEGIYTEDGVETENMCFDFGSLK